MTLQERIATILDTPVFDGKLYYIEHPDHDGSRGSVEETYGVFSIVSGTSFQTLEGDAGVEQARVQISIYTVSPLVLISKVNQVKQALLAANLAAENSTYEANGSALYNYQAAVQVDGREPDSKRFYSHLDYYCWH